MIGVVVVAEYPTVRAGLRALLANAADCAVLGEATTPVEAMRGGFTGEPDVLLGEWGPAPSGDESEWAAVADEYPTLGLVVLSDARALRYLPLGRRGHLACLGRDATPDAIVEAVRAVAAGLVVLDARMAAALAVPSARLAADATAEPLTPRELEVLALLAQGLPNKTIGQRLAISEHTVKFHVGAIFSKLGAGSRTE